MYHFYTHRFINFAFESVTLITICNCTKSFTHKLHGFTLNINSVLVRNWMLHSIDETRRDHIRLIHYKWALNSINYKENGHQNLNPTKMVETIEPLNEYVSNPPFIFALLGLCGLSTSHIPMIYLPNSTLFGPSHPTSKYFDPHISQI